ncbi:Alpha/Beta hydrolase protein, partial [Baffinella frigidus]
MMRSFALALVVQLAWSTPLMQPKPATSTAVVLWHGMGDTCCLPFSMGAIEAMIVDAVPGAYVTSLMVGKNEADDQWNGFFLSIDKQLEFACETVKKDPNLAGGFHMVGFSQGGLFARSLVETCDGINVKTVVSIGGPQNGVYGLPKCTVPKAPCEMLKSLLDIGAYDSLVQHRLVQAQYWNDAKHPDAFLKSNIFLPGINNLLPSEVKPEYKARLATLEKLVLVMFESDTVVIPKESEWFGWYA